MQISPPRARARITALLLLLLTAGAGQTESPVRPATLAYRLTVSLPGAVAGSYCRGNYRVQCGNQILGQGSIALTDLSTEEGCRFEVDLPLPPTCVPGCRIRWNFRGEVFDAKLARSSGPMVMQQVPWDTTLEGVGFHIAIDERGNIRTTKRLYWNTDSLCVTDLSTPFPEPDGPFEVGVRSYFWIDANRAEVFTSDPDDHRHLLVQVWYPARANAGTERAYYLQNPETYGLAPGSDHLTRTRTNAWIAAPLAPSDRPHPVLLFSHGLNATRFSCTFLMEHLASHGYVIFSIGHTFFNGVEVFPDGYRPVRDIFPDMPEGESQDDNYRHFSEHLHRTKLIPMQRDAFFVLDQIEHLQKTDGSFFYQRLDLGRMGMCGWSLGGVNAALMCASDLRLKAGINLDGTLNAVVAEMGVDQPFLIMKSDHASPAGADDEYITMLDKIRTYEETFRVHSPRSRCLTIVGAAHTNFSDEPLLGIGEGGRIDTERCHEIVSRLARAFFDVHVMDRRGDLFDEIALSYEELRVASKVSYNRPSLIE